MTKLGSTFNDFNSGFCKRKDDCGKSLDACGWSRRKKNDMRRNLNQPLLATKKVFAPVAHACACRGWIKMTRF